MNTWKRRSVAYTGVLALSMFVFTVVYQYAMGVYERDPVTFLEAFQFVVETFTTTGYGAQSGWESAAVLSLVAVENGHEDHVIVATYTPRVETLIAELDSRDIDWVIVEPDRERATDLYEDDYDVIHRSPDSADGLDAANFPRARALVADVSDQVDASIVLTAKELDESVRVVSVVEEPDRARYHELAGADAVLTPRSLLGESLARKITASVTTDLGSTVELGQDFEIVELPVHRGADVAGETLAESGFSERAGVNVIGAWFDGEFESPPEPDSTVEAGSVLLMTGQEAQLERLADRTRSEVRRHTSGETLVVGHGEVGQTITNILDGTDPAVLDRAGLDDARSVILAIPDDTAAEFATLVVRDRSERVEIIARAEEAESGQKMYRAGADYVLALGTVTGRMVASAVLEDERTGVTVVAVERNGDVVTDLDPEFRTRAGDELIVAGPDEATNRFTEVFG
ncbi:metal transporter [Halobacteriales archaeon QH_8_67_27]|nr:MAG: metal transporter [Halobacteriales archaeon QH_8_67_27]